MSARLRSHPGRARPPGRAAKTAGIRVSRLDNGLTVVTDPMDTVETTTLGVWVSAGTRHESAETNGVSHMLEHMAFKGTTRRSAQDIAEEIEAVGGHLNAYTSRDHTAYYAKVLKEDVALALDIVADILQSPAHDPDELAREQAVVSQEIAQAVDTPDDIIFDYFQSTAYPGQAVGWPVLGTAELVRGFTRKTLAGFMAEHYGPRRMILAAAGRIEHDALVDLAGRTFTDLPDTPAVREEEPRYEGGDYRENRSNEQVHVIIGFDGVANDDPDFYAASVLSTLLGGGMSSRLFQEVRERRGLAYSVYSFTASLDDSGLFGVYAGTGEEEAAEVVPVVCDEVMKVTEGVRPEEVHRARAQIKAGILMSLESTSARCEQVARQIMAYGRPIPVEEIVAKIEAVEEADVTRLARRLFASRPTVTALGPLERLESYARIARRLG